MVEEFEDVVFNLGQGQVSDVFRTRFGFHIAKVYDRRPASIPPLEEVRKHIVDNLQGRIREDAINDFIDSLKDGAVIEEV
jgi:parvulin-like peptidyl-prolyl isomerase